jgi:hypothetical protein
MTARTIFLDECQVSDAGSALTVSLWQSHGSPRPFTIRFGCDEWLMTVSQASAVASAASRIEQGIAFAMERGAEVKPRLVFHASIPFSDGHQIFEMGIAAEPGHLFLDWAGTRVTPGWTTRNQVFNAMSRMGEMARLMPGGGAMSGLAGAGSGAGDFVGDYRRKTS